MRSAQRLGWLLASLLFCELSNAQQASLSVQAQGVPRLVNFSGKGVDAQGKIVSSFAGANFATKDQSGHGSETAPSHSSARTKYDMFSAAETQISTVIGKDQPAYHFVRSAGAFRAPSLRGGIEAEFTREGADFRIGPNHWSMALRRYGYSGRLRCSDRTAPTAQENRIEYHRGALTEWYENGPLGLEQGFTLTAAPGKSKGTPLTIELVFSGDLVPSVEADRHSLRLAKNGTSVLRYSGLSAKDASGRELDAWLEIADSRLQLKVNDADAYYPITVDPYVQAAKLTDGAASDLFGTDISMSQDGNTIVVGAPLAIVNGLESGAAYVFVKPSGGWSDTSAYSAKLVPYEGVFSGLFFGQSVSISADGSTIVVDAPSAVVSFGGLVANGAAYVFVKPSNGWSGTLYDNAQLYASDTELLTLGAGFGSAKLLAVSGDGSVIAVGATMPGSFMGTLTGVVYVFTKPANGWSGALPQTAAELTASDHTSYDSFAGAVAMSSDGSTIVVGAPTSGIAPGNLAGAAYLYVEPAGGWASTSNFNAKLTNSATLYNFGVSVSVSGDGSIVVVGENGGQNERYGSVYVYYRPTVWASTSSANAKIQAPDVNFFGNPVNISEDGNTIVAGSFNSTNAGGNPTGALYIFQKPPTVWTSTTAPNYELTPADDVGLVGLTLAVSGDGSIIASSGGPFTSFVVSNAPGAAYVFSSQIPSTGLSTTSLAYASQVVGTTSNAQPVTLTNTGGGPLHVTAVTVSGNFTSTSNCVTQSPIAINASCTEYVSFAPTLVGSTLSGTLTFTDDSGGTSGGLQTVSISGSSVAASSTTSITNAAPNPVMVNQPVTISYTVAPNPTNDAFTPSGTVTVSASMGESCVGNVPTGSCQITFASAVTRNITATYTGDSNFLGSASQANSEQVVDFTLSASPASLTISSGHTATYTLTANPLNGFTGTVSLACSGGPPNSTCSVSPNSMNVPGANSASAVVTLSAPKNANHGTFTLTFSGTNGIATRTATAILTVK